MFNVGEPSRKRMKKSSNAVNTMRSSLPDLVIHRILTLLPTKAAVRMSLLSKQWEGVWSLSPVLDFDESSGENDDVYEQKLQHKTFIHILQTYLEYRKKDTTTQTLDKFRLVMTRFFSRDSSIVDKWLSFSFERSVREVDLSLKIAWDKRPENYYCISPRSIFNGKSMTSLNLEFVRIQNIHDTELKDTSRFVLPWLKNMSMKSVYFGSQSLLGLIWVCPSIECLSLTSCSFENLTFHVSSYSLRYLEAKDCVARHVRVGEAMNLESYTFSSKFHEVTTMTLAGCVNLKYINIHAPHLESFNLYGCHGSLNATIYTPLLRNFQFRGFRHCKMSLTSQPLRTANILFRDMYDGEFEPHLLALRDFLKAFDGSDEVTLNVCDFRV